MNKVLEPVPKPRPFQPWTSFGLTSHAKPFQRPFLVADEYLHGTGSLLRPDRSYIFSLYF